jgi:hypothetical protein
MALQLHDFDATLAAAGEDPALMAELRAIFRESLERQTDLLKRARCDGNWIVAAQRLRSLGASFNAPPLILLAEEALFGAPGDPAVVSKLEEFAAGMSAA